MSIVENVLCLFWNNPKEGEKPRFAIRRLARVMDESYKSRYVDEHNVYWDNVKALPPDIAYDLEDFIDTIK